MDLPASLVAGRAGGDGVGAGGRHIDCVFDPLAGIRPADEISAAGVGGGFDVHAFAGAVCAAVVGDVEVVISNPFAAGVEIFELDGLAGGEGCAFEGTLAGAGRGLAEETGRVPSK